MDKGYSLFLIMSALKYFEFTVVFFNTLYHFFTRLVIIKLQLIYSHVKHFLDFKVT